MPAHSWSKRYGKRHRLVRIVDFPSEIAAPRKVRIYRRRHHFVLQWWDPTAKTNLSDRVDGDLVAAIARARQIEERLNSFRSSGQVCRRLGHGEIVEKFLQDLAHRADAGEVDVRTVERYRSALDHYLAFIQRSEIEKAFPNVAGANREFQLAFAAFLNNRMIASNGHANTPRRAMKDPGFVEDAVRAMYQWAADPERGHLLTEGFRNPFLRTCRRRRGISPDPVGIPDISMPMAARFLQACDSYQLRLFAPIVLFGLRAAEPVFLFREHLRDGWLQVPCIPDLSIMTKSRRNKTLPVPQCLESLLASDGRRIQPGLLHLRRPVLAGTEKAPLQHASLAELIQEFQRRCSKQSCATAPQKFLIRDNLLGEAGALNYDHVESEFHRVAHQLDWPRHATLKDFRHLFSTSLENAGVPLYFRQYLMGQAPTNAPITTYTHLAPDQIRRQYEKALCQEFGPVVHVLLARSKELNPQRNRV